MGYIGDLKEKTPVFIPFNANLTHFEPKSDIYNLYFFVAVAKFKLGVTQKRSYAYVIRRIASDHRL